MALLDLGSTVPLGPLAILGGQNTTTAQTTLAADAPGEGPATVTTAPKDGTITAVGVRCHAVTGNPAAYSVGIVSLDASFNPTATGFGGAAVASYDFTATGWVWVDLTDNGGADVTVQAGDALAARVWAPASGVDAANYCQFASRSSAARNNAADPRSAEYAAGAWSDSPNFPLVAMRYSDGTCWPCPSVAATSFGSASFQSPDEQGATFTLPFGCRVVGLQYVCDPSAVTDTATVRLYGPTDTVLAEAVHAANDWVSASAQLRAVRFDPVTLAQDTVYRAAHLATSASNRTLMEWAVAATADKNSPLMTLGTRFSKTSRSGGGAWTDLATTLPMWALLIDAIEMNVTVTTVQNYFFGGVD